MKIVLFFFLLMNNGDIMKDLWQLFFASPSLQSHTKKKKSFDFRIQQTTWM